MAWTESKSYSTKKQLTKVQKQRILSWKLKLITGAIGNIRVKYDEHNVFPADIITELELIAIRLKLIGQCIRHELGNIT